MNKLGLATLACIFSIVLMFGIVNKAQHKQQVVMKIEDAKKLHAEQVTKALDSVKEFEKQKQSITMTNKDGVISNFEGPIVAFEYLSHHGKIYDIEIPEQREHFRKDTNGAWFDPDHPNFGLPDLKIIVDKPRFKSPEFIPTTSAFYDQISALLPKNDKLGPYKHYEKIYISEDGHHKVDKFDLYLTEFNLTLDIRTLRGESVKSKLDKIDKTAKKYPRHWYTNTKTDDKLYSLDDIDFQEEWDDSRYADLDIVFKVSPNYAPWYISDKTGTQKNAEVAVGAIIVSKLDVVNEDARRLDIAPSSPGQYVSLYSDRSLGNRYNESNLVSSFNTSGLPESIFNKDYFFRITSKNIGSWKKNFGIDKWDDRVTFTFLLPILVKGSFDVVLPSDLIPEYIPPKAYAKSFELADLVPDWGLNNLGKYITYGFATFIIIVVILFVPNILILLNTIVGLLIAALKRIAKPSGT